MLKVSSAEGDAVYLGNSVIGIAFTFKMMVFFNYSINISIFTSSAEFAIKFCVVAPKYYLKRFRCGVFKPIIDIVVTHRGAVCQWYPVVDVVDEGVGVLVKLGDCERTAQNQVVDGVGKVA